MAKKEPEAPPPETYDFGFLAAELEGLDISVGPSQATNDLRGYISTGCAVLDAAIGQGVAGGYPMGRFTELYGVEGTGKTTMATSALISCQRGAGTLLTWVEEEVSAGVKIWMPRPSGAKLLPGLGILIDSEFKWPVDRAQAQGLNVSGIVRIMPKEGKDTITVEDALAELDRVIDRIGKNAYFRRPDVPVLVVWDSLASAPIEAEMEGDGLRDGIASKARKVRSAMRKMTGRLATHNVTCLIINQVYDKIGSPYPMVESSGGRGLKFHSTLRLEIRKSGDLMEGQEKQGITTRVKCRKSSICPPTFDVEIPIRFSVGIDDDLAILDFFLSKDGHTIITKKGGSWYQVVHPGLMEPVSFQYKGWPNVLSTVPGLRSHLLSELQRLIHV